MKTKSANHLLKIIITKKYNSRYIRLLQYVHCAHFHYTNYDGRDQTNSI